MAKKTTNPLEPGVNRSVAINPLKPGVIQSQPVNPLEPGVIQSTPKGSYDQTKGGYTTPNGAFYPTSNPDFVPSETDSNIEFLPNKNVKVSKGNVTQELTPQEYAVLQGKAGAVTNKVSQIGMAPNLQQRKIQQLIQMAQEGLLTPEELQAVGGADLDISQALGAGFSNVLPSLVGGATGGAIVGAAGGSVVGGVGAVPGAIAVGAAGAIGGAITGFLNGIRGNIKSQQVGEFAADKTALTKGERYLRSLITDTNQNPQNAPENIALFYQTLNNIDAAHAKTWKDSQENLNIWLSNDGTQQLANFEVFDATMRNYYLSQFNTALNAPNPNQILINSEDLNTLDE